MRKGSIRAQQLMMTLDEHQVCQWKQNEQAEKFDFKLIPGVSYFTICCEPFGYATLEMVKEWTRQNRSSE